MGATIVALLLAAGLLWACNAQGKDRPLHYLPKPAPANCSQLSEPVLSNILGPAFNSRYMSIDKPPLLEGDGGVKRDSPRGLYPSFYVEENHAVELGDGPAWDVNHVLDTANPVMTPRTKRESFDELLEALSQESHSSRRNRARYPSDHRSSSTSSRPWECEAKIRWIDLGQEYYPRWLRNIECTRSRCWYGHYQCVPRSFTVKILRKRSGECVPSGPAAAAARPAGGNDRLPDGLLRELWVWEEHAVNFCCDCTP